MKIEIKSHFTGNVLFAHDAEENSIEITLQAALSAGADLRGANLYGANLRGANLYGDKLTKTPLFLYNLDWDVTVTTTFLRIGCQVHLIDDWKSFDDDKISSMASGALEFWRKYKTAILALCDAHQGGE